MPTCLFARTIFVRHPMSMAYPKLSIVLVWSQVQHSRVDERSAQKSKGRSWTKGAYMVAR